MTDDDTITLSREALRHRLADLYCVALHHEHTGTPECRGTQAADQVISELLAPPAPPPTLREQIIEVSSVSDYADGFQRHADAVIRLVAERLAEQSFGPGDLRFECCRSQRERDVAWIMSQVGGGS